MSTSHSDYLKHVHQQREELSRLVAMADDIQHMINGLKGIERLDDLSIKLPEEIEMFINQYTSINKDNSVNELKGLIRSFDHRVHSSLRNILNMTMIDITRDMDQREIEAQSKTLHKEVGNFEEYVYTAIGTRLHMKERNLQVPLFKCEIPIKVIKENINKLDEKEKMLRVIITEKIDCMLEEISVFLNDASIPQEIKEKVLQTQACLLENKEHVVTGNHIEDINLMIDLIDLQTEEEPEPIQTITPVTFTAPKEEDKPQERKTGLLKRFGVWISTPLEVKWEDTKKL